MVEIISATVTRKVQAALAYRFDERLLAALGGRRLAAGAAIPFVFAPRFTLRYSPFHGDDSFLPAGCGLKPVNSGVITILFLHTLRSATKASVANEASYKWLK